MNKNLCIRKAIKRNRFGAEKRAAAEWGRIHQAAGGSPIKRGSRRLDPEDPSSLSLSSSPAEGSSACVCCVSRRRLPRDRRRIVAAKFIPLTHPPWANARARERALLTVFFSFPGPRDEIGFTILRCPWKPGTSGLCASHCILRLARYRAALSPPLCSSTCGFFPFSFACFFFFTRKLPPSRKYSRYRKRRTFIARFTIVNAL